VEIIIFVLFLTGALLLLVGQHSTMKKAAKQSAINRVYLRDTLTRLLALRDKAPYITSVVELREVQEQTLSCLMSLTAYLREKER
jgi:hypothetical protein